MAHHGVYMYPYNQQVSLGNFNMPFNNEKLTIYKGANNTLSFTVHNADGKYTLLKENEYLVFSIFNARNNTILYETTMAKVEPSWLSESGQARPSLGNKVKVYYGCVVPAGVIEDTSSGSKYRWTIKKVTMDGTLVEPTQYLYTGLNFEASAELIISNAAAPTFTASTEISVDNDGSWLAMKHKERQPISKGFFGEYEVMHTSPIAAEMQYGLVDGLSTIAIYTDGFLGRYQLQGCLLNNSPDDSEDYKWFPIKLDGNDYIENCKDVNGIPIPMHGIKAYNFRGNYMWLRLVCCIAPVVKHYPPDLVRHIYNPLSTIPKILIRR